MCWRPWLRPGPAGGAYCAPPVPIATFGGIKTGEKFEKKERERKEEESEGQVRLGGRLFEMK